MAKRGPLSQAEREIVSTLIETKAINFQAIGEALAKHGPSMAFVLDGEEGFCGTMRYFVRTFILHGPVVQLPDLSGLRQVAGELRD